ncbi:hypothetical protein BD413DRAFT_468258 [Trametes elegans]|nr:hypothetical protein BD413DRAFT_468258 [Trametes elegans]
MSYNPPSSSRAGSSGSGSKTFQTILAGRKCYRVSKDKNEVVWPPQLEAALIEGLEKYTPAESKSPRGLSRFPNRNKFIAQYILQKTGQIRSAKQVGSRIQQLRDTSAGKHIMKAISDRHYEMMHPTRPSQDGQQDALALGMPGLAVSDGVATASIPPVVQVYISVPPAPCSRPGTATWPPSGGQPQPQSSRRTEVNVLVPNSHYAFVEPRALRSIDPTVTFASSSPLPLFSKCNVYQGATIAHVGDSATMAVRPVSEQGGGGYLHFTSLAPGYWDTLCNCEDLSPFSIVQEISKQTDAAQRVPATVIMTIQYQFLQASTSGGSPPLSPFSLNREFEYDGDSGSDVYPLFPGQPLSTGSDSPLRDRSSSPAHNIPGFASQPLSPVDWMAPPAQDPWTAAFGTAGPSAAAGGGQQLQPFPTPGFYGMQQPQTQQTVHHPHPHSQSHSPMHPPQQRSPPGQFYGPPPY